MKLVKNETAAGADFGWIGKGVEIIGDINFTDRLQIDGKVSGKLYSEKGTLIIGEGGLVEAEIDVGTCVIHGIINGDLKARARVEIHKTGKLSGDVITPALVVEEGSLFNGAIRMVAESTDGKRLSHAAAAVADNEVRKIKEA